MKTVTDLTARIARLEEKLMLARLAESIARQEIERINREIEARAKLKGDNNYGRK